MNERIDRWRRSLLDLTLRNRLLDARDARTCIGLTGDPVLVAATLDAGGAIDLPAEREAELTAMARAAREAREEGGAQVLYVALGLFAWKDSDGEDRRAPLVLAPVELRRGATWTAVLCDEPRVNETLIEKLRGDGITVEVPDDDDEVDVAAVLAAFAKVGMVLPELRIGTFTFTKFVMWNDLHALSLDAPLVRHLASNAGEAFVVPAVADATGALFCPLDADATQLAAVRAAEAGRTFVLQGPPGTGKSQTIANLIAQCLSAGKTVLFVSEKMAALEVVQGRLAAVGLGDFCLQLHSHRARKRAVLDELGRTLERAWRPAGGVVGDDAKLDTVRAALDEYVRALHEPDADGLTLHDALARLCELADAPRITVAAPGGGIVARRDALAAYAAAWQSTGGEAHPWRDADLAEWQLSTGDAVAAVLAELDGALTGLDAALAKIPAGADKVAALAAQSPRLDGSVLLDPKPLAEWLDLAKQEKAASAAIEGWQLADVKDAELDELAAKFRDAGFWSWLTLRGARARMRELGSGAPAEKLTDTEYAEVLARARTARQLRAALAAKAEASKRWLGELADKGGDLAAVERALAWAKELREAGSGLDSWRAIVASVSPGGDATAWPVAQLALERWRLAVERLAQVCGVKAPDERGLEDEISFVRARLAGWRGSIGALRDWTAYVRARRAIAQLGLGAIASACEQGQVAPEALAEAWERGALIAWADAKIAAEPALRTFHGSEHHARVAQFAELDRASLGVARARLIMRLAERVPKVNTADEGELGILLHELKKQRRHRPLRKLFAQIPNLIGKLKPCVLMSPLSVAQYLDPAAPPYDLVVFDEASQIPTADAIGALARARAAVIVGDSKQLPPTRFFEVEREGEQEEYEELESILDECVAARLPELRLGWHYRSRHEDLIAFSNHRYYDDALAVFPAAASRVPDLGVQWKKVDGVYDRAGTRTNRKEAEAVVAEVLARIPRGRSIGVVTFSRAQQDLIEDLLDAARKQDPSLDAAFLPDGGAEPVLVKNLETIQGDERDVILFSIGYGPDASGKLTMTFGPLNQEGGERRLNVAVTRAREQLVVFSSFEPEAITQGPVGVRHLGELLGYAKAGGAAAQAKSAPVSAIVETIAAALRDKGHTIRTGVGCASYRIDLAVVDPDDPGRYVLGIEHDGAAYASARATRDRDRLRAQVLGQLGWRLHRIWSLDWSLDAEKETQRAHNAIIAATAAARAARKRPAASTPPPVRPTPYRAAVIPAGKRAPDDLHDPAHEPELLRVLEQVMQVEAPLHLELLARRVGAYFGIARVTDKVTERVRELAEARARVIDDVVWRKDQDPQSLPPVRAADAAAETRREADEIPISEVAAAAAMVLGKGSLELDELARETAKLLGFARLGDRALRRMRAGIDALVARGACKIDGARASVP